MIIGRNQTWSEPDQKEHTLGKRCDVCGRMCQLETLERITYDDGEVLDVCCEVHDNNEGAVCMIEPVPADDAGVEIIE